MTLWRLPGIDKTDDERSIVAVAARSFFDHVYSCVGLWRTGLRLVSSPITMPFNGGRHKVYRNGKSTCRPR